MMRLGFATLRIYTIMQRISEKKIYSEFFQNCHYFRGPYTWQCYATIWEQAGCLKEGDGFPGKVPELAVNSIKEMNLK